MHNKTANFKIEKATEKDIPVILSFIRKIAEYEKLLHEVIATEQTLLESFFGENRVAEAIISYIDDKPVGFSIFFYNFSSFIGRSGIYIEDLYVDEEHRGNDIGKAMLEYIAKLAKEKNCGRMEWSVLNWNEPAIRFYKSIGAVPMDEWTVYRANEKVISELAKI